MIALPKETFCHKVNDIGELKQMSVSSVVMKCSVIAFFKMEGLKLTLCDIGNCDSLIAPRDVIEELDSLIEQFSSTQQTSDKNLFKSDCKPTKEEISKVSPSFEFLNEEEMSFKSRHVENFEESKEAATKQSEKLFNCDRCERNFQSSGSLKAHYYRTHHEREVNFQCSVCPRVFIHLSDLVKHSDAHVTEFAIHKCNFHNCNKEFKYERSLRAHMKKHSSPFIQHLCSQCGKGFSSRYTLNDHISKFHEDNSNLVVFECKFCLKSFNVKSNLSRHIKTYHSSS